MRIRRSVGSRDCLRARGSSHTLPLMPKTLLAGLALRLESGPDDYSSHPGVGYREGPHHRHSVPTSLLSALAVHAPSANAAASKIAGRELSRINALVCAKRKES